MSKSPKAQSPVHFSSASVHSIESLQSLTKGSFSRLGYQAGVKSFSSLVYEQSRQIIGHEIHQVLEKAINYSNFLDLKTINVNVIVAALPVQFYSENAQNKGFKTRTTKPRTGERKFSFKKGTVSLREMKFFQKQFGTLLFAKAPFERVVREVASHLVADAESSERFSEDALLLFQHYIEHFMIKLYKNANLISMYAGRVTVQHKDVELAHKIASSVCHKERSGVPDVDFGNFLHRALKQHESALRLTVDAKSQLNGLLNSVSKALIKESVFLTSEEFCRNPERCGSRKVVKTAEGTVKSTKKTKPLSRTKKTVNSKNVSCAAKNLFAGTPLESHASAQAQAAIASFEASAVVPYEGDVKKKSVSSQSGLIIPTYLIEKLFRRNGVTRLSKSAVIYLAGVLEYVSSFFLTVAAGATLQDKKMTLTIRHLTLGFTKDATISKIMHRLGFELLGGGVVPHIHAHLLPTKKGAAAAEEEDEEDLESVVAENEDATYGGHEEEEAEEEPLEYEN